MAVKLTELLARVPYEVEGRVRKVRDQARAVLQEALRAECRLVMRTPEETDERRTGAQVPVEVDAGYPISLAAVSFSDDLVSVLGPYRSYLESMRACGDGLLKLHGELSRWPGSAKWPALKGEDLKAVTEWATVLLQILNANDPLAHVLEVDEDILGVYEYDTRHTTGDDTEINRATIRLYWCVIGLGSEWMGVAVEDLTVVVLAHELAHAYTQLGADIDGRRWPARRFADADHPLKEGLAQYYTERVLRRLGRRFDGAHKAYEVLLARQPEAYRTHLPWTQERSPEAVRRAVLEVRRWHEGGLEQFERRLGEAERELHPGGRTT